MVYYNYISYDTILLNSMNNIGGLSLNKIFTKISQNYLLIIVSVYFLILSCLIPLTWDDWAWKSRVGLKRLYSLFDNYNGRYLSNILEIIFVRSFPIRVLIMTICSTLLVFFIHRLMYKENQKFEYLYILFLIMLIPLPVFAETFGWLAGYANYVVSATFLLAILYTLKILFNKSSSISFKISLFVLGIISMLFVEHVSLYLLLVIFCANVYYYTKKKRINVSYMVLLISSFTGLLIMFSNSSYYSIATGTDQYRTISNQDNVLIRIARTYSVQFTSFFFANNILLLIVLTVLVGLIIYIKKQRHIILNLSLFCTLILSIIFVVFNRTQINDPFINKPVAIVATLIFNLLLVLFIAFLILNFRKTFYFYTLMFSLVSMIFLVVPFLVITPFSNRCTFASYIFLILIIIGLTKYITENIQLQVNLTIKKVLSICTLIILCSTYLIPISINRYIDYQRISLIEHRHYFDKQLVIKPIPFTSYHYFPNLNNKSFMTPFFKDVYKIPKSTEVITK